MAVAGGMCQRLGNWLGYGAGANRGLQLVRIGWRVLQAALIVWILSVAVREGVKLRHEAWEFTKPIRFQSDIQRNLLWGLEAANHGYLNLYERQRDQDPNADVWLDYAPLRLALMWHWGEWVETHYPAVKNSYNGAGDSSSGNFTSAMSTREYAVRSVWRPSWEFHQPILEANMAIEGLSAMALFFLIRVWVIRHYVPGVQHDPFRYLTIRHWTRDGRAAAAAMPGYNPLLGCWRGLIAVLLAWFSPAILMSAYGWPTYDSWVVPAYLWAVLLASTNRWFLAGIAVGIGAMAKGQILAVAPVFLIWALWQWSARAIWQWLKDLAGAQDTKQQWALILAALRGIIQGPGAALRCIFGFLTAIATIASPWMFTYPPDGNLDVPRVTDWVALHWAEGVVGAAVVLTILPWAVRKIPNRWVAWGVGAAVTLGLALVVLRPLWLAGTPHNWAAGRWVLLLLVILLANWVLPARGRVYTIPAAWGMAALLCVILFHGSLCWAECGWGFGMKHWPEWTKVNACNVPGVIDWLLNGSSGFSRSSQVDITDTAFTLPRHALLIWPGAAYVVTWKALMNGIFVGALIASGVAMGRAARRGSVWFLAAQAAPFLVFFLFPVQIHERYLLFGTGVAFAAVGASFGMGLLAYILSIITTLMTAATAMWLSGLNSNSGYMSLGQSIDPQFGTYFYKLARGAYPHTAWAVLAITGVFLWSGMRAKRREAVEKRG